MKNLRLKYRFNPKWTYSTTLPRNNNQKYTITEFNQICSLFETDETKPIGHLVNSGTLFLSIDKKTNYLYKTTHEYVLEDGIIVATYEYNSNKPDPSVFPSNTTFKTQFGYGCSGKYAFKTGKAILKTDDTYVRTVNIKFTQNDNL
jgi:hypothetical protein